MPLEDESLELRIDVNQEESVRQTRATRPQRYQVELDEHPERVSLHPMDTPKLSEPSTHVHPIAHRIQDVHARLLPRSKRQAMSQFSSEPTV